MGIPAFYRWLVGKYPLSVTNVLEEIPLFIDGTLIPVDSSKPNPNGIEFDNLYLDMNGIIHPCFHPEGLPAPKSYEEVFKTVFKYIDHIFSMIRPRSLLYMAIDGVAPRAKMNQQRARRFRAAKDAADVASEAEKLTSEFISEGEKLAHLEHSKVLDSNVITPGTEFMATLSTALQYYIHLRLNTDPGWRGIEVILSDANVPGEGEHKIMSHIRLQRNLQGFDPNTRHCLYGLDADLIMLALATHEVHFVILREDIHTLRQNDRSQKNGGESPHPARQEERKNANKKDVVGAHDDDDIPRQKFQFLKIWVLRDYLEHDMRIPDSTMKTDLERLVDDFVFMCLFVGNDFLPHMPSLEISEGAIDLLMNTYKKEFVRMGGYLTNSSEVDLGRVEYFIQAVGSHENAIFRRRSQLQKDKEIHFQNLSNRNIGKTCASSTLSRVEQKQASSNFWSSLTPMETPIRQASQSSNVKELQSSTKGGCNIVSNGSSCSDGIVDKIRLGEEGWKERYYSEKFEARTDDDYEKIRRNAVLKYAEGICWVMHYYYQGVCSWQWFYPYHYAPFASDFYGLDQLGIHFMLGYPFKPFDQLMGVLPAASAHALPLFYRKLMTDSSSPIADFYPTDFDLDMNGKRYTWQAVCKLPFIKESRLLAEIAKVENTLTDSEKQRNSLRMDVLFVHISHPLATKILSTYRRKKDHPKLPKAKIKKKIDPMISGGMNGYMYISDKTACLPEGCSPVGDMEKITENRILSVFYKYPPPHPHIPRPPKGLIKPGKTVSKRDVLPMPVLWHEKTAVLGRIFTESPVPKSISGPYLAKLAHQLVSKYYLERKQLIVPAELNGSITDGSISHLKETDEEVISAETSCMNEVHMKKKLKKMNGERTHMNDLCSKRKRQDVDGEGMKIKKQRKKCHEAL
ncbi:5'-3' exoribonuclease 3-like isoform X2 [Tasmannia lanceolata]|uniref:5'-3' exoribonuclease 3-like isoform X2 n=1 Tax=Tasmannia lanceolata TaxID=3420 RepID=UPI0040643580